MKEMYPFIKDTTFTEQTFDQATIVIKPPNKNDADTMELFKIRHLVLELLAEENEENFNIYFIGRIGPSETENVTAPKRDIQQHDEEEDQSSVLPV